MKSIWMHSCLAVTDWFCVFQVVDAGAVPLLVLCVQEPELSLKRISASALSDICKHSPELAQTVVDAGAIAPLAQMILNPDAKLKVFRAVAESQVFSLTIASFYQR